MKEMTFSQSRKTKPIQTQSKPIQSQLKPIKCQNKPNQTQNKPNSKPISEKPKMNVSSVYTKDYENETAFRLEQNKPNQTRSEFTPKGAEIPTGELLGILKPGTNPPTGKLLFKFAES